MSTKRTPPRPGQDNLTPNVNKRVRSDEDADERSQSLTLEAVMNVMNQQFARTLARIEEININISGKIDNVKAELEEKLGEVSRDISTFKADCTAKFKCNEDALCALDERVDRVTQEIGSLQNRNELIVSGIPCMKDENLTAYFHAMWKHVGLHERDVPPVDLRRLKSRTENDGLIVLQFALRNNRDDFYSSYLRTRDLKLSHLGIDSTRRIYVNENLNVEARKVKAAALRLKKAGKLASVYTKLGTVQVKQRADQDPVAVHSEEHLDQFM